MEIPWIQWLSPLLLRDQFKATTQCIMNWTATFEHNLKPPKTVAEAVGRLLLILEDAQKITLAAMTEGELFNLHFSLGLAIRNGFGLHDPGSQLIIDCGTADPDDASGLIISELWQSLKCSDLKKMVNAKGGSG